MTDAMRAETVTIPGAGGDEIEAYLAQPLDRSSAGGVVVIHHMPGYDEETKEITRKFAAHGYLAICPNLYWREAPGASPDDAAAAARAQGGVPDERLVGDVGGAAAHLRSLASSNGKVATIGYCSGGRQSFLAACSLRPRRRRRLLRRLRGRATARRGPAQGQAPSLHLAKDLSCPLLGLFGAEDQFPSPAEVAELEKVLTDLGKNFEFHTYEGAGHAFFATNRPSYRPEAANDGWEKIWEFFGRYLGN